MERNFNNANFYELKDNSESLFFSLDEALKSGFELKDLIGVHSELLLDEHHGIYIPKLFVENTDLTRWGLNPSDYEELKNPENEWYWDLWVQLLTEAQLKEENITWYLIQDGDLFAQAQIEYDEQQ